MLVRCFTVSKKNWAFAKVEKGFLSPHTFCVISHLKYTLVAHTVLLLHVDFLSVNKTTSSVGRCLSPHLTFGCDFFYQLKRWREVLASFFLVVFQPFTVGRRLYEHDLLTLLCMTVMAVVFLIMSSLLLSCNVKIPDSWVFFCLRELMVLKCLCYLVLSNINLLRFNVHIHIFACCLACSLKTLCTS